MRKFTRRTVRDPRGCITRRTTLSDDQTRDLGLAYHISLQALLRGNGGEQAWSTLSCSLNIAMILCERGFCAAALPTVQLAQDALMRVKERAARTEKWALDGDGARVLMAALNIHDEQISRTTQGQIADALQEVHRRILAGDTLSIELEQEAA